MGNNSMPSVNSLTALIEIGKSKPANSVFPVKLSGEMRKWNDAQVIAACAVAKLTFQRRWQGTSAIYVKTR